MTLVYIALGTNLGERTKNLAAARRFLKKKILIERISSIYETEPWGFADQPNFLNQVLSGKTTLSPEDLLFYLKELETKIGRQPTFRYGPRVIDLDILFYAQRVLDNNNLVIPHPRLHERVFVLAPLAEIAPEFVHPVKQQNIQELLELLNEPLPKRYNQSK